MKSDNSSQKSGMKSSDGRKNNGRNQNSASKSSSNSQQKGPCRAEDGRFESCDK